MPVNADYPLKGKRLVVERGAAGQRQHSCRRQRAAPIDRVAVFVLREEGTQVRKLIAGSTVYICNECVTLCAKILREEGIA